MPSSLFIFRRLLPFLCCIFLCGSVVRAQGDSCRLRISLLTCSPGDELYSLFGHGALRVYDSSSQRDIVYNYGTFDFDDPDFYTKFIRGKLLYMVSVSSIDDFLYEYAYFQRGVSEQVLSLNCTEKSRLAAALANNALPQNRFYHYDFTYDNCVTRLRDQVAHAVTDSIRTEPVLGVKSVSFRNLIHDYLNRGGQPWSKLGIDILLGARLDKKISDREAEFLPDYLESAYDKSQLRGQPLVLQKNKLLDTGLVPQKTKLFSPSVSFGLLFLLLFAASFIQPAFLRKIMIGFDVVFFLVCGLIGALLLFMWWGTDHFMTKDNFNLAWAMPTHFLIVFFMYQKRAWVRGYFKLVMILNVILLLSWFFLPQVLNPALLPVTGISLVRSYFLSKVNTQR